MSREMLKIENHPLLEKWSGIEKYMVVHEGWIPMPVPLWLKKEAQQHQRDFEYAEIRVGKKKIVRVFRIAR